MKYLLLSILVLVSFSVSAERIDCGYSTVGRLYAVSSRSDGNANANRLQVDLPSSCSSVAPFGFVANDDPAYQGILSLLLAAKMSNKPIRIVVDDSVSTHNSVRVEWVNFE